MDSDQRDRVIQPEQGPASDPVIMPGLRMTLGQSGLLMAVFGFTGLLLALPAGLIVRWLGERSVGLISAGSLVEGMGWAAAGYLPVSR